jgi:hypothetical protein
MNVERDDLIMLGLSLKRRCVGAIDSGYDKRDSSLEGRLK